MHLTPAEYVIKVFGGVNNAAKVLGRGVASVSQWRKPKKKNGCEGRIPGMLHKQILNLADVFSKDITSRDLIEGRDVSQADLALLDEQVKKAARKAEDNSVPVRSVPKKTIDTEWFMEKIQSEHESLRKFTRLMFGRNDKPLDVSAMSLTLRGRREMRIDEARQIAKLLKVDVMEVIKRA